MKPIVGEITYKDLSKDGLDRYIREAEMMRAEAMRASIVALWNGLVGLVHAVRAKIGSNIAHGIAHSGGAR